MIIYKSTQAMTVGESPPGLFELENGTLICKSEYTLNPDDNPEKHRSMCIICDSGEYYCGEGDAAKGYPIIVDSGEFEGK